MIPVQELVDRFLVRMGHDLPARPDAKLMTPEMRRAWAKIFLEEALELVNALDVSVAVKGPTQCYPEDCGPNIYIENLSFFPNGNGVRIEEAADGAADTHYVASAIMSLLGVEEEPIVRAVCENNLAKFGPGHAFKDGKLIKPPGHPKPPIERLLRDQGMRTRS